MSGCTRLTASLPRIRRCTTASIYGGAAIPQEPEQRARVLALVNILADSVDYGLMTTSVTPVVLGYEGWRAFAVALRRDCPALVHVVRENPGFYPGLVAHWNANPETAL
ncbi:hypothetical protein OHT93_17345 [Streptomyces sp. NBC_00191]|uniref:hypothetical protein n=1 Tax=Streptomyces sp. NBC_00191 TaxID=2975674 RepID=UPI0032559023